MVASPLRPQTDTAHPHLASQSNPSYCKYIGNHGAQGRNRTTDTVIFSHVLYQLSYLGAGRLNKAGCGARGVIKVLLRSVQNGTEPCKI
jgi:hypothetical protein